MKKTIPKQSKANSWLESLKNNPKEIIEWAECEIREYKKLIKIIKDAQKNGKEKTKK